MRLPSILDLTDEQKNVYLYAPVDQHVLVSGPPGTGKTMIACFRAQELHDRGRKATLGMFNRVLKQYASSLEQGAVEIRPETITSWFRDWWGRSGLPPHPCCQSVFLNVPYAHKDQAKLLGARWDSNVWVPWKKKSGAWVVGPELWREHESTFRQWPILHDPPSDEKNPKLVDWKIACAHLIEHEDLILNEALETGTLLVDEGQDLPPDFYRVVRFLSALAAHRKAAVQFPPRCFVLADENQQLTEYNSTLKEIAECLKIEKKHQFQLLDNFRNTHQIARFSERFYADIITGLPRLPLRQGEVPEYVTGESQGHTLDYIVRAIRNNPGKEFGIFTFADGTRKQVYVALKQSLEGISGRDVFVQTYGASDEQHRNAANLKFDRPDTVTVINVHSCKGLEFDWVFIVNLSDGFDRRTAEDRFKMQMFVATSRARERVTIIDLVRPPGNSPHLSQLPTEESVLVRREATAPPSAPMSPLEDLVAACIALGSVPRRYLSLFPEGTVSYSASGKRVALWNGFDWEVNGGKWLSIADDEPIVVPNESPQGPANFTSYPVVEADPVKRAMAIAASRNLTIEDKRNKGGCFWVKAGRELDSEFSPLGFVFKPDKGWWHK